MHIGEFECVEHVDDIADVVVEGQIRVGIKLHRRLAKAAHGFLKAHQAFGGLEVAQSIAHLGEAALQT